MTKFGYKHTEQPKHKMRLSRLRNLDGYVSTNLRRIRFKGKWLKLDFNPRIGMCERCGRFGGKTNMHHFEYDDKNPLANVVELCQPCHKIVHSKGIYINDKYVGIQLKWVYKTIKWHVLYVANLLESIKRWNYLRYYILLASNV